MITQVITCSTAWQVIFEKEMHKLHYAPKLVYKEP